MSEGRDFGWERDGIGEEAVELRKRIRSKKPAVPVNTETDHQKIDERIAAEIGKRLKEFRSEILGVNQTAFSKPLGVSRGAVGNWEVGQGINVANLFRVARVYDISLLWLSTGRGRARASHIGETIDRLIEENALSEADEAQLAQELIDFANVRILSILRQKKPQKEEEKKGWRRRE